MDNYKAKSHSLPRILSLSGSILMVIGIMIGTGVFKKISPMSALGLNESWIIIAWIVAGIVTILGALTIFGLASLTDESGGEYEYLRIIFGDFTGFIFGWACFTIIGSASISAMSYLFSQSLFAIFPLDILLSDNSIKITACLVIIILTLINALGTKKSIFLNSLLTILKITGLLALITAAFFLKPALHHSLNFFHFDIGNNSISDFLGLFFAAMLSAFWAYDGWLSLAFMSGEIKNPKKNVPIAIVTGILIVMVIYVLVNMAYLFTLSKDQIALLDKNKIAADEVSLQLFGPYGHYFISVLILISSLGSLNGIIISYSRLYYKMSQDGYFFKSASDIHSRFKTPHVSLLYSMLVSIGLVFSGTFDTLTDMIVFAGFFFYALLAYGLIKMKKKGRIAAPKMGYPIVPVLFIIFSLALMVNCFISDFYQTLCGAGLIASGIPFYFFFKKKGQ